MRPELDQPTERISKLPVTEKGYPVPWFVAKIDGKYDFRIMDSAKLVKAVREHRCWTCGDVLGSNKTFVVGPMCGINRTSAEPPSHFECAQWSVRNCPFLSMPKMVRREDDLTEELKEGVAGIMIPRNPGVTLLWTTKKYTIFKDEKGRPLFNIGHPEHVEWWSEKKYATREQVEKSVDSGLPSLVEMAKLDGEIALIALGVAQEQLRRIYPDA